MLLSALQSLHGCKSSIELLPVGGYGEAGLEVVIISTWYGTRIGIRPPALITKHGTVASVREDGVARIFGALHEHDAEISRRVYGQEDMFRV